MRHINVGLEWFLNPDHLPFIVGIKKGLFKQEGLEVELIEPKNHYDGLKAVAQGEIEFACNEPLHMLDENRPGLRALGCFFETQGGVMLTPEGESALREGADIKIASPVAGEVTDKLALLILESWCQSQGIAFTENQCSIESAGFEHVHNMQQGYHGAWLCFANFEGVEAQVSGFSVRLITSEEAGIPNFSALELFVGSGLLEREPDVVAKFTRVVSQAAAWCLSNPDEAGALWYEFTNDEKSELTDKILDDTCKRFIAPLVRDSNKWSDMFKALSGLGIAAVDAGGFKSLYR